MADLISPADGCSLSTGYYSSPKLVGLHIFFCMTSELESSIQIKSGGQDGKHCLILSIEESLQSGFLSRLHLKPLTEKKKKQQPKKHNLHSADLSCKIMFY